MLELATPKASSMAVKKRYKAIRRPIWQELE
jgi:hypothetical protein